MKTHDKELLPLKEQMQKNNLLPAENILVDNQRHIYWGSKNDLPKQASYIATRNPVGKRGPRLICSYGFIDEKKQFTYSSFNRNTV